MNTISLSKILSTIFESRIFELARSRSEVKAKISSYDTVLAKQIIKCIIFPNSTHRIHWLKEVNFYLANINLIKIKPSKQKFSSKEYMKMLWEPELETVGELSDMILLIRSEYTDELYNSDISHEDLHIMLYRMYENNICEPISNNRFEPLGIHIFDDK